MRPADEGCGNCGDVALVGGGPNFLLISSSSVRVLAVAKALTTHSLGNPLPRFLHISNGLHQILPPTSRF